MMRRTFYSLLAVCGALLFASCNNGVYDANSDLDKTGVPTFTDPKYAQEVGEIKFKLNDEWVSYYGSYYTKMDSIIHIAGYREDGNTKKLLTFNLGDFEGFKEYALNAFSNSATIAYSDKPDNTPDSTYGVSEGISGGKITLLAESENVLYGTFEMNAIRITPTLDTAYHWDIKEGSFKLKRIF